MEAFLDHSMRLIQKSVLNHHIRVVCQGCRMHSMLDILQCFRL